MLRTKTMMAGLEVRRDFKEAPCAIEVVGDKDEPLAESLARLVTDAYLVHENEKVPRRGIVRDVLMGNTEWEMDGFQLRPSSDEGELSLIFTTRKSDELLIINLWAADTELGFGHLTIDLPYARDLLRTGFAIAERFTFLSEFHDGRKVLTIYCAGDPGARYYPRYCKGDTFDEQCVIKDEFRSLTGGKCYAFE